MWRLRTSDGHETVWNDELDSQFSEQKGYTQSNLRQNEDMPYEPTYRAKPLPATLLLRWEDRVTNNVTPATDPSQLYKFQFALPREIRGFNKMILTHVSFNIAYFDNPGAMIALAIAELGTSTPYSSVGGGQQSYRQMAGFTPQFLVSNSGFLNGVSSLTKSPLFINYAAEELASSISIRDLAIQFLTITLGDESLQHLVPEGSLPTDPYYCNLVFRLE
jgi:hypothetical protein